MYLRLPPRKDHSMKIVVDLLHGLGLKNKKKKSEMDFFY